MKKKITFKKVYLIYLVIVVLALVAAIIYVNVLLHRYEDLRPEVKVEEAMAELKAAATDGSFWEKYSMPAVATGKFEANRDVQEEYLNLFRSEDLKYSAKSGLQAEDELAYLLKNGDEELAEITLKAKGPAETKLVVFSFREWEILSVRPLFEPQDYYLSLPQDFKVLINGIGLTPEDGEQKNAEEISYFLENIYREPDIQITDRNGRAVNFKVKDGQVVAEFYVYSLTLPEALRVEVNATLQEGEEIGNKRICYNIYEVEKPEVVIKDYFGNSLTYVGGDSVPLTIASVTADSRYMVKVSGKDISAEVITVTENKEFAPLADYAVNLPRVYTYDIAVLEENATIEAWDEEGNQITLPEGKAEYDLLAGMRGEDTVPEEISEEIDLLQVAHDWSLFMSNDLAFSGISKYMIKDSYQYEVARKYATGADITYTSAHRLGATPFTDDEVTNFQWISENSFSVDISFVKHMVLNVGTKVDDPMNDRFYFVKYDDTDDGKENPTWKLVAMKEIVNND